MPHSPSHASLTTFSGDLPHTQVRSGCCFFTKAVLFFGVKDITDQQRIKNHLGEIVVDFEGQMNYDFRGLIITTEPNQLFSI